MTLEQLRRDVYTAGLEAARRCARKEALLFEKRSKNFGKLVVAWRQPNAIITKVFWFFFSKKNAFLKAGW